MNYCRTQKSSLTTFVLALIGALLGVVVAVLFANGFLPTLTALFIPLIVIGLLSTILLFTLIITFRRERYCLPQFIPITLISALALVTLSVLALGATVAVSTIFTVLVFFGATFFFITIIGLIAIAICLLQDKCFCHTECRTSTE